MQSPTGLTRYILTIHEANPRRPTAAHCNSVKSTADLPLQLGEAFYRGAAAWIKSDMWTAKRFLIHDELRKRLTVEDYDEKIFAYLSAVTERRQIGPLLTFITKVYLQSIKSLTLVFAEHEWPALFALKRRIEGGMV